MAVVVGMVFCFSRRCCSFSVLCVGYLAAQGEPVDVRLASNAADMWGMRELMVPEMRHSQPWLYISSR